MSAGNFFHGNVRTSVFFGDLFYNSKETIYQIQRKGCLLYTSVYTSADSVFQIAAHEDVVPIEELYRDCEIARRILVGEHGVGRVIARPFIGTAPRCV